MNEIQDRFANKFLWTGCTEKFCSAVFMYSTFLHKQLLFPEKDPPDGDIVLLITSLRKFVTVAKHLTNNNNCNEPGKNFEPCRINKLSHPAAIAREHHQWNHRKR